MLCRGDGIPWEANRKGRLDQAHNEKYAAASTDFCDDGGEGHGRRVRAEQSRLVSLTFMHASVCSLSYCRWVGLVDRAGIGGVRLAELNALELAFLITIDFDLIVRREEYDAVTGWLMAWSMSTDVDDHALCEQSASSQDRSRRAVPLRDSDEEPQRGRYPATRRRTPVERGRECRAVATAASLSAIE